MLNNKNNEKAKENDKKNEKTKKVRAIRTNWHFAIMYPDNPMHVKLLDYLKRTVTMAYIKHDPDEEEIKEHWHDIINFAQTLCTKRTKECQDKLKDYE